MLISAAPIAIPVSTANPPTEAVATDAAKKVPIPQPTPSSDNPTSRQSTDNPEFVRTPLDNSRDIEQNKSQDQSSRDKDTENQSNQEQKNEQDQQSQQQTQETQQQAKEVAELAARDREVRAHETAHASAGGALAGAPQLSYTTGPDGKRYAVSGEVSIDTSKVNNDPQATIAKMSQVRKAALAPANPSAQDLKVAAIASQVANQAQIELIAEQSQSQSPNQVSNLASNKEEVDNKGSTLNFANPVAARRSSLQLNQRLIDSGALEDANQKSNFSKTA